MNAAFENDLESSVLDSPGHSNTARPNENYDDLVRNKFIRPGPSKTNNWTTFAENIEIADSNTDILFSELKEQLEDEEFLNSELAKKNNSLEEEIQRLKDKLAKEQCLKNNCVAKLEQVQNDKRAIEIRLKDEQETLNEIANGLQEEQEINCQHQILKNGLLYELEKAGKNEAHLRNQLQQLQEDKEENIKRLQDLEKMVANNYNISEENKRLREQLQSDLNFSRELNSELNSTLEIAEDNLKRVLSQYEETSLQLEKTEDKCRKLKDKLTQKENILKTQKDKNQRLQIEIDDLQDKQQQRRCKLCCIC